MKLLHLYYIAPEKRPAVIEKFKVNNIDVYFAEDNYDAASINLLLIGSHEVNKSTLKLYPNLQIIQIIGHDSGLIDRDLCREKGIKVSQTTLPKGHIIAEHAIGLAISGLRNFTLADQLVRLEYNPQKMPTVTATEVNGADNWPVIEAKSLYGSKVGIVGLGAVGLELLKRLKVFGCEVSYFKRDKFSPETESRLKITYKALNELLQTSDILFFQLPYNEQTKRMITSKELQLLKPSAIIINCGRAAIFDECDLMYALAADELKFAGLDVFWQEPLPKGHPICRLPNVILTPHMAEIDSGGPDVSQLRQEAMQLLTDFAQGLKHK